MAAKKNDDKTPEEEAPAPSSKLPLITMVMLLLNMGATGFVAYSVTLPPPEPESAEPEAPPDPNGIMPTGPLVKFEPFLVNLNEPKKARYLRMKMQMELTDEVAQQQFDLAAPVLRSEMLAYLSNLTVADTMGAEAKTKISTDLLDTMNDRLGREVATRVLFEEFVVQ